MRTINIPCCAAACFAIMSAARADVFHMGLGLTSLDFVTVGNPGNAPDTRYPNSIVAVGAVDHIYQIGKYEITAGQYTEYLNAVAKADPNGLYNTAMADPSGSLGANIVRTGSSPKFSYSVAVDWANRPVNYVNFWDAARFANWLDNGQPTGLEGPGTTEDGAYHDIGDQILFGRNPGVKFFIPTENEWYKAAYHNKSAGLTASYFDNPTGSNTVPSNTLPDPGNHANFYDAFHIGNQSYTIGQPYFRTEVGAFVNSPSPYGTFDQGGNVWEWNQTQKLQRLRGMRGGSFAHEMSPAFYLQAALGDAEDPSSDGNDLGFRIASAVPEPSSLVLGTLASFGLLAVVARRRRLTMP